MFSNIYYKLIAILLIFSITLLGGLLPIRVPILRRTRQWFAYGNVFAGGVFLGVGLIHLLPEAQATFQMTHFSSYPWVFLVCAATILLLHFLEDETSKLFQHHEARNTFVTYLLAILLSIHSLIEGAALGVESTFAGIFVIFIAIFSHKSAESFSLGISVRQSNLRVKAMIYLLVVFSLMTPIGILFGSVLSQVLVGNSGYLAKAIFDAVAGGTFIYIATAHSMVCSCSCHDEHDKTNVYLKLLSYLSGLLLMAIVAVWL